MKVRQEGEGVSLFFSSGRSVLRLSCAELEELYLLSPVLAALSFPDDFAGEFEGTLFQFLPKEECFE